MLFVGKYHAFVESTIHVTLLYPTSPEHDVCALYLFPKLDQGYVP